MTDPKHELRNHLRRRLNDVTQDDLLISSKAICKRLQTMTVVANALIIACYVPFQKEIDLMPMAQAFSSTKKVVAFPRFNPDSATYQMAVVNDFAHDFVTGQYGIKEPDSQCSEMPAGNDSSRTVWFVPGIGFDRNGKRLGRGGGHYDRLLSDTQNIKIGVACNCQVVDSVPVEQHDIQLDYLVTETATYTCNPTLSV